jgi:hypothetical protein
MDLDGMTEAVWECPNECCAPEKPHDVWHWLKVVVGLSFAAIVAALAVIGAIVVGLFILYGGG